ncbi:hypothetical protein TcWFU_009120 [Taenia crassiceps]|uniref:Uncharacterized protein n=1 Tax=Taenia crassiceps TaxID=6207 RepID=A0ABR4QMT6_9CEST
MDVRLPDTTNLPPFIPLSAASPPHTARMWGHSSSRCTSKATVSPWSLHQLQSTFTAQSNQTPLSEQILSVAMRSIVDCIRYNYFSHQGDSDVGCEVGMTMFGSNRCTW